MREKLPYATLIVLALFLILPYITSAFKIPVVYELSYYVEINDEGNFTINVPLPPKLSWQETLNVNVTAKKGNGIVEPNNTEGYIRIKGFNSLKTEAKAYVLTIGSYDSEVILEKLNVTFEDYLRSVRKNLRNYGDLVKPTYWWNYSDPRFNIFLKDFVKKYNLTSVDELKKLRLKEVLSMIRGYVSEKLKYRPIPGGRQNIFEALNRSMGDCSEYSDAFIVFSRYLGIPTLRCIGYVAHEWNSEFKEYEVVGHAWPIIYIENVGWVPYEVTVGPGYLRGTPGDISPKYICLLIDSGVKSINNLNLNEDIIYDPKENWVPGSSSAVNLGNLTLTIEIAVKPKPQFKILEKTSIDFLAILISIFPLIIVITLSLSIIVTVGDVIER